MSLLCRHDRVLWVVNMTSAGEKQHYALALIQRLFDHLPPNMTVGILYDIGCQLHRSCEKWGFLKDHLHCITFGISVFHAYGHQWPCQIVYHPHKCSGFGLSDGEGCERFWSSLKKLIPSLRVSGVSCVDLHHHPPILIFVSVSSAAPCSGQPNSIFWWKVTWIHCALATASVVLLSAEEASGQWEIDTMQYIEGCPSCRMGSSDLRTNKTCTSCVNQIVLPRLVTDKLAQVDLKIKHLMPSMSYLRSRSPLKISRVRFK